MLTQFGHVEVINSIEADFDDSLCGARLKMSTRNLMAALSEKSFFKAWRKER